MVVRCCSDGQARAVSTGGGARCAHSVSRPVVVDGSATLLTLLGVGQIAAMPIHCPGRYRGEDLFEVHLGELCCETSSWATALIRSTSKPTMRPRVSRELRRRVGDVCGHPQDTGLGGRGRLRPSQGGSSVAAWDVECDGRRWWCLGGGRRRCGRISRKAVTALERPVRPPRGCPSSADPP